MILPFTLLTAQPYWTEPADESVINVCTHRTVKQMKKETLYTLKYLKNKKKEQTSQLSWVKVN